MYPQRRIVRQVLRLALLAILVVLALSACGGNNQQQTSEPRPLPEEEQALRPGVYRSEEFEPSFSFRVGEGWSNVPPELPDELLITRGHEVGGLGFANVREVYMYKPTRTSSRTVVEAPEDMVGWFRQHPYLRTDEPEPVTVGGVEGERVDVVVGDPPKDYYGECGSDCVDLFRVGAAFPVSLWKGDKARFIVLEDVQGDTVIMGFISPSATKFDEHAPEAQKVIDTVKWGGS
jgi:hypothetical protein